MKICSACGSAFSHVGWLCPHCGIQPEERNGFTAFAPGLCSNAGFRDDHFNELIELEARNFWFRARNRLIVWALLHYFPNKENLLEVGCGTGFVLNGIASAFPKMKLSGSEISSVGLAYAAKRLQNADLFQMDARSIPFCNEFDVIAAFDVLEHIEEDETVLAQMYQAIRIDGGLMITVPQHKFLWSRVDEHACHVRRYAARDLVRKVKAAGFEIVRKTSFVSLLLPLMMASRSLQRGENPNYDPLAELRISDLPNNVFERIMAIERWAIRLGFCFPVGGSLLLIAKKVK